MSDSRYTDLGLQPLAGEWRHGRAGRRLKVSNPFDGSLLLEIEQADRDDLDAAYAKAAEVQPAWAALGPSARAAVLYKAVEVFDRRHEEIVDWIIRESGSTRLKAEIEWARRARSPWSRRRSRHGCTGASSSPTCRARKAGSTAAPSAWSG
ncbi:aldehyde dehydrogenase family protein [Pseudomonas aeruginosa]